MSTMKKDRIYVDPILIEEGFFDNEEDYVRTMDEVFEGLRKAADQRALNKQKQLATSRKEHKEKVKYNSKGNDNESLR